MPCLGVLQHRGWLVSVIHACGWSRFGWFAYRIRLAERLLCWTQSVLVQVCFYLLTILIVQAGVKNGIEKWSTRLMPALFVLFGVMFIYVMTLPGATEGLAHYLIPDFSKIMDSDLILAAMGQGFFSLTIGGCSMLIYGSYLSRKEKPA